MEQLYVEGGGWRAEGLAFAARDGVVPHHVPVLQDAGDGEGAVRLHKALLAEKGHGAAQLQALSETLPVDGDPRVRALVVPERCGRRRGRGGR